QRGGSGDVEVAREGHGGLLMREDFRCRRTGQNALGGAGMCPSWQLSKCSPGRPSSGPEFHHVTTVTPYSRPASETASHRYCPEERSQCRTYDGRSPFAVPGPPESSRTTSVTTRATELRNAPPSGTTVSLRSTAQSLASTSGAACPVRRIIARPWVTSTTET